ncbi:hypothetical protein C8F01DRAFT_1248067 [Mycena amicta]|nr:hypothetical protein C8F01DRAFT_1248067 [Mycena amicta]
MNDDPRRKNHGLSPAWEGFHMRYQPPVDSKSKPCKYKTDTHHNEAYCAAEINKIVATEVEDAVRAEQDREIVPRLTLLARQDAVLERCKDTIAICGKIENLTRHLKSCEAWMATNELIQKRDAPPVNGYRHSPSPGPSHHSSYSPSPGTYTLPSPQNSFQRFSESPRASPAPLTPLDTLQHLPSLSDRSESPVPAFLANKWRRTSGDNLFSTVAHLSQEFQAQFNDDLCDWFASCNIAWNVVNQPASWEFFRKWIPAAKLPDRRKLSGPILDGRVAMVEARVRREINGKYAVEWKNSFPA